MCVCMYIICHLIAIVNGELVIYIYNYIYMCVCYIQSSGSTVLFLGTIGLARCYAMHFNIMYGMNVCGDDAPTH